MFNGSCRFARIGMGSFLLFFTVFFHAVDARSLGYDSLVLLLPDTASASDPRVAAWLDAAQEEGVQLTLMHDADFIRLGTNALQYRGLILPDQVHQNISDELVSALEDYVSRGGRLMLVYDAGALTPGGFYAVPKSRFSALAGVDYVLYEELRDLTIGWGPVSGPENRMRQLMVPPGKSMPFPAAANATAEALYLPPGNTDAGGLKDYDHERYHRARHEMKHGKKEGMKKLKLKHGRKLKGAKIDPQPVASSDTPHAVTGYVYGFLNYPSYVTRGTYAGDAILTSPDFGLVAGTNSYGEGKVLFVNLPLGYLKGQTDGMLMHGFLRYFAVDLLGMPHLASAPNGRGGLVLNWHVDSAAALEPMAQLARRGVWDKGPYSIHFTAGPDTISFGDGAGLNVPGNRLTQSWIRYFDRRGHKVGSHGGWIHDYFGLNANETNQAEFEQYLALNKTAIEKVLRHPIKEYSAPQGNNPIWAMNWLENNGFRGYYFTGHTGMGPTRTYRDGRLMNPGLWAFPVTPFGEYATFEEFAEYGVSAGAVTDWLARLVDFSVQNRTSRLIYFHPPGAAEFPEVVDDLLEYTSRYQNDRGKNRKDKYKGKGSGRSDDDNRDEDEDNDENDKFRWYTMTDLARFLAERNEVSWRIDTLTNGYRQFEASHPRSLAGQTWILPRASFEKPGVNQGKATVKGDDKNWIVTAESGTVLRFSMMPR